MHNPRTLITTTTTICNLSMSITTRMTSTLLTWQRCSAHTRRTIMDTKWLIRTKQLTKLP